MSTPDLVLHVGMQQSGATMLQRALSRLRPQLRRQGIAFVGHRRIAEMAHLAGWRAATDADPAAGAAFARELAEVVEHERRRVAHVGGVRPRLALLSSDHLLGAANIGAGDEEAFRRSAVPAVRQVISALGAERARLVLYTQRQDRLMELCYQREIRGGAHHTFAAQFPRRFSPVLDYAELVTRLASVAHVADVGVRPFELHAADPPAFVDDVLAAVGLRGALDLGVIGDDLTPHHVYSRRGLKIALGMNPHLETDQDRRLVRQFLLEHFAAVDDRDSRFLPKRVRREILTAYRECNRHLFRSHMADLPEDAYDDNAATERLASVRTGARASVPTMAGPGAALGSPG